MNIITVRLLILIYFYTSLLEEDLLVIISLIS